MIHNQVTDAILARRSVRVFEDCSITKEELDTIVECGRYAPNARNFQTYRITVVTDQMLIRRMAEITAKHLGGVPEDHNFFGARQIIVLSDCLENYMRDADCACVLENMFIAAQSLGIGSVWINQFETIKYLPDVVAFCEEIGIEKNHYICGIGAFGYPMEHPEPKPRTAEIVYFEEK